jgi:hypothetical protein
MPIAIVLNLPSMILICLLFPLSAKRSTALAVCISFSLIRYAEKDIAMGEKHPFSSGIAPAGTGETAFVAERQLIPAGLIGFCR